MKVKNNSTQNNIPLYAILGFNVFTLLAFVTAPYDWSRGNPTLVVVFLIVNYIAIFFGFKIGTQKGSKKNLKKNIPLIQTSKKITSFFFIFYIFTFLIKFAYLLRFPIYDVKGMFSYLTIGIVNPQLGYELSVYDTRPHTVSWSIFSIISIVNQVFFIYGFLNWNKFKTSLKTLFVLFVIIEIYYWLGRGTGFGIVTIVTTLAVSILTQIKLKRISFKLIFIFLALFTLGITAFGYLKNERAGGKEIELKQFDHDLAKINENHFMLEVIPKSLTQTYLHSVSYMTQGYYHLGLAMDCSFSSTFLFGNNPESINLAETAGVKLWEETYMYKTYKKHGVDDVGKWHSAYLWYANDVSFYGVPIILFILSSFTGYAFSLIIKYDDLLSKLLFVILMNMLLYLFANNSYLSQHLYSLIVIFILWYFTRVKRFN